MNSQLPPAVPVGALQRGIRSTLLGMAANIILVAIKLTAGIFGHSYALIADAIESIGDVVSSLIILGGLRIASRQPNELYPYGYGRAETLAATAASALLIGTGLEIGWVAIRQIQTPHRVPQAWTLAVLLVVIATKWTLSRKMEAANQSIGSKSIRAEVWHHFGDAITSAATFIGIFIAVWNGPGWESADDWAALVAGAIIVVNGGLLLKEAIRDLMDRKLEPQLYDSVRKTAEDVPKVLAIEKLVLRRTGLSICADIHVQAAAATPLADAHALGGKVKAAIRLAHPEITQILVHMEPFEEPKS